MKNLKLTIEKSYLNIGDYLINDIGNEISTLSSGDKIKIISPYISKIPITNSIAKYSNLSETDDLVLELLKKEIQIEMISSYKNDIFKIIENKKTYEKLSFIDEKNTFKNFDSIFQNLETNKTILIFIVAIFLLPINIIYFKVLSIFIIYYLYNKIDLKKLHINKFIKKENIESKYMDYELKDEFKEYTKYKNFSYSVFYNPINNYDSFSHSKIILLERKNENNTLFFGSMNFTKSGLTTSVEMLSKIYNFENIEDLKKNIYSPENIKSINFLNGNDFEDLKKRFKSDKFKNK